MKLLYSSLFLSITSLSNSRYSSCANEISTLYRDLEIAPFLHLYNGLICIKRVIACKQCASFTIPATVSYTIFLNIYSAFIYIFEKCWEQLLTYIFKVRYLKDWATPVIRGGLSICCIDFYHFQRKYALALLTFHVKNFYIFLSLLIISPLVTRILWKFGM